MSEGTSLEVGAECREWCPVSAESATVGSSRGASLEVGAELSPVSSVSIVHQNVVKVIRE